jgi:hypothetical protein
MNNEIETRFTRDYGVSSSDRKFDVLRYGRLSRPDGRTRRTGGEQETFSHSFENGFSPKNGAAMGIGSRGMNASATTGK